MTEIAQRKTRGPAKKDGVDAQAFEQLVKVRLELDTANAQLQTEKDMARSLQNDHRNLQIELRKEQEKTAALQGRIGHLEADLNQLKSVAIDLKVLQAVHGIVDDDRRALFGMVGNALNTVVQEAPANKPTQIHPPAPQQITGEYGE